LSAVCCLPPDLSKAAMPKQIETSSQFSVRPCIINELNAWLATEVQPSVDIAKNGTSSMICCSLVVSNPSFSWISLVTIRLEGKEKDIVSSQRDCSSKFSTRGLGILTGKKKHFFQKKTESRQPIFPEFFWEEDLPARQLLFFFIYF
jgi:hypothetical protein